MHTNASPRRLLATLSVAALLFAGAACSAEGDDASPSTTVAGGSGDASTTTDGGSVDETTTTESDEPDDPSDLEALLPSDDDLPSDYVRAADEDDDDSDSDLDEDLEEACPDAARISEILDDGGDSRGLVGSPVLPNQEAEENTVSRTWETDDQREIEVELSPAERSGVPVDDLIDAINDCDLIETDLDGTEATIELSATSLDLGDEGMRLQMVIAFEVVGKPAELTLHGFMFRRDDVSVEVSATSGIEQTGPQDFVLIDADDDVAEQLAADLDEAIQDR